MLSSSTELIKLLCPCAINNPERSKLPERSRSPERSKLPERSRSPERSRLPSILVLPETSRLLDRYMLVPEISPLMIKFSNKLIVPLMSILFLIRTSPETSKG